MKLSTLNSKLSLLSVGTNSKTSKSDALYDNTLTAILYLSPYTSGGFGNVCSKASPGCITTCLNTAGRGAFSNVQKARQRKTELFFKDNAKFKKQLNYDLKIFYDFCNENSIQGFVRLNGTSDIDWSKLRLDNGLNVYQTYPNLNFYEYTKDWSRISSHSNFYITYSKSESITPQEVKDKVLSGNNVAVVFTKDLPSTYLGLKVIDGDETDLRFYDERTVIVGLKAKGKAKKDTSGFVIPSITL